jgi:hypothetical protein
MELVTNVDQWISQVTKANDGDNRDASNIAISVEGLSDRTYHLYTHALLDTTAKPAGNGGAWDFGTSSNILFKGGVTFTPTSTVFFSSGGDVTLSSTPKLNAGMTVTSGTVSVAGAATLSGATTISGAATLSGATTTISSPTTTLSGAGNKLKLTPRSVTRKITAASGVAEAIYSDSGVYITNQSPKFLGNTESLIFQIPASSPLQTFNVPLELPHGCKLTNVSVAWSGTCQFSAIVRRNGSSVGGETTTTNGTVSLTFDLDVNRATESFAIELTCVRTAAINQQATIGAIFATYEVSEYDEG